MSPRRIASALLLVLAALSIVAALATGYARTALLDSDQFADRATSALQEPPVRTLVAAKITDEAVLRANRDLVSVRPLIESAAGAIVSTGAFESIFHRAVRDLHRTAFTRDRSTATLTLLDVGVLLSAAIERFEPRIARQLPDLDVQLSTGDVGLDAIDTTRIADELSWLTILFGVGALTMLFGAVLLAPERRRGVVHAGIAVAVSGVLLLVAYQLGRARVVGSFAEPDEAAAVGAIWDAFLQDLRTWAFVILGCGTVVAAAAASLLRPVDVRGPLARAWDLVVTVPERPALRALRAIGLVAAGVLMIAERDWLLDVALILAGVYVLYQGVEELLRMIARPRGEPAPGDGEAPASEDRVGRRPAALVAGTVAAALVAALVVGLVASGGTDAAARAEIRACNGHPELCDRPLDEVAMAGTHNAMSAVTNPGYLFGQQEDDMAAQLEAGVRVLMIDAHNGERVGDRVRTVLDERKERADLVREIGEPAVDAALRIRDRLVGGGEAEEPTTWLCHGFCELGATRMTSGLRQIRDFVAANPHEVVVIVIQDEGPTAKQIEEAFDDSGLLPYVYTGPVGTPWPTLREIIASGERVIVMAENQDGGEKVPWLHAAYDGLLQETPYHFTRPSELSCAPNRGDEDGSLFLLNHWIDTSPAPRPSNAAKVNAYDALLGRARECERARGLMPNVIAVDFYETGDLFDVVDTLNGIQPPR